jgi:hypothetical protein
MCYDAISFERRVIVYIAIEYLFFLLDVLREADQIYALGKYMNGGKLGHLANETAVLEQ